MAADEEAYPDGRTFNPARWLDPSFPTYKEPLTKFPNFDHFLAFGHGRRACPGYSFTESSLLIMIARLAWACDIKRAVDPATKQELELEIVYEPVPNPKPLPFPADIAPRSLERIELVRKEVEASRKVDPLLGGY